MADKLSITEHARRRMDDFGIGDDVVMRLVKDAERKHIGFGRKSERVRTIGTTRHEPDVQQSIIMVARDGMVMTFYVAPLESKRMHWVSISHGYVDQSRRSRRSKK